MVTEFQVTLEDKSGALAHLCMALGDAEVNIEAIHGSGGSGKGRVLFVGDDPGRARSALLEAGIAYTTREVIVVRVLDEPGMLGDVALVMSEAGINIDSVYVTTRGHVVLGVDDLAGAMQVAGGMAVVAPR